MINNKELIKPLLNFDDEGDFYFLMVLKRKKDFPELEQKNHQSVRTIKTYCIDSVDYLEKRWEEIVGLCELFGARAYIHVQKQNHKDVSLHLMELLCSRIRNVVHNQKNIFDSIVGQLQTKEKRWVVDVDKSDMDEIEFMDLVGGVVHTINNYCQPILSRGEIHTMQLDGSFEITQDIVSKIITTIPTKNGVHLITKPFHLDEFKKSFPTIEVQRKNPTLLYYPNSLK